MHLYNVTISISQAFLSNTKRFGIYPSINIKELKSIDEEFQAKVGYSASFNHFQDYKIYKTMIKMFCSKFLNNLR